MTNILEETTENLLKNDANVIVEDKTATEQDNLSLKKERIIYLYRVTNLINNKIYIGQTVDPNSRWRGHIRDSNNPKNPFQKAISKYGVENFVFEVIACCKGQDNANDIETQLVTQYDSFVTNGKGYNATHGGFNAPKSDAWKASMKNWHNSLTPEEKAEINKKRSEATINQINTKGHPAQGHKWTEEQRQALSEWRLSVDKEAIYTPEVRQKMRESHLGQKPSEETLEKRAESLKAAWKRRNEIRCMEQDIRCHAEGCEVSGSNIKYRIIDGVRYCGKHGSRMKRNGHTNLLPRVVVEMTEEIREKISQSRKGKCLGRVPHNRVNLTAEQVELILKDERSIMQLSKDIGIGRKVISRIRSGNKQ